MIGTPSERDRPAIVPATGPVWGGVLSGGASRRMGQDKACLTYLGRPFVSIAVDALRELEGVCRLGSIAADRAETGEVVDGGSESAGGDRLPATVPDIPGIGGPLAGMLAALRKRPGTAWVLVACDLPLIDIEAVAWLVAQRARGRRVILPSVGGRVHPLFALYEPSALELLEELAENHQLAPTRLVGRPGVVILEPPVALHRCWTNVNTPEELAQLWEIF